IVQDTLPYEDLYPSVIQKLNKKHFSENNNYYMLSKYSDSTVKISSGNDTINRTYDEPLDFAFAERLSVKWANKDYLILNYNTGSGAWLNLVMPINNKQQVEEFSNGLCFDNKYNLLVSEESEDTILAIRNLKTEASQFVVEKQRPCEASGIDACLDTISIK